MLEKAQGKIVLGADAALAKSFSADTEFRYADFNDIADDEMGLDVGPKTIAMFKDALAGARTVVWNGPMGVFEFDNFAKGTVAVCELLANLKDATTIIGGGDSAAAAIQLGFADKFTHISTGGGASLEYLEGKTLPGVECINDK